MSKDRSGVLVIGASNLDIKGHTHTYHVGKTSNPGTVRKSAGGVGRNIAENLARLSVKTTLLSAVGNDVDGRELLKITGEAGVDLSRVLVSDKESSGIFMAILNHYGELISAVADLDIISEITPEYLQANDDLFDQVAFVVMDADVPTDSLVYSLDKCNKMGIPVCVEPISVAKSKQMIPYLSKMTMVTPNREEAEVLAGFPLRTADDVKRAGLDLVQKGVRWAIITLGPEGVLVADKEGARFLHSVSTVVADTVGAGDALTSGSICGLLDNLSLEDAVKRGIACATLTLSTPMAVHPELSLTKIKEFFDRVQ